MTSSSTGRVETSSASTTLGSWRRWRVQSTACSPWLGSERRYEGKVENALADLPDGKFYKDVEREVVNSSICRLLLERNSYDLRLYEQAVELSHAQRAALAR